MTIRYVDLVDYVAIAADVTGLDVPTVMKVANLDLADSALHAPAAGFGDTDLYPDFVAKATVLVVRLADDRLDEAHLVGEDPEDGAFGDLGGFGNLAGRDRGPVGQHQGSQFQRPSSLSPQRCSPPTPDNSSRRRWSSPIPPG